MVRVVIWGCGEQGRILIKTFDDEKVELLGFVDHIADGKCNVNENNISVVEPSKLLQLDFDYLFVSSRLHEDEIIEEIRELSIEETKIVPYHMSIAKLGEIMDLFTERGWQYMNTLYQSGLAWRINDKLNVSLKNDVEIRKRQEKILSNQKNLLESKKQILEKQKQILENQKIFRLCNITSKVPKTKDDYIRIGLITLSKDSNIPERIIAACTKYLIEQALRELNIDNVIFSELLLRETEANRIIDSDVIFFVGGGIIKYNNYWSDFPGCIDRVTMIADTYNIPVMFVGAGVEAYDEQSEACKILQHALNRNCVKMLTVRDNMPVIKQYVVNSSIKVLPVADPALHTASAYGICRNGNRYVIGIGTINFSNWELENHSIEKEVLLDFYSALIEELETRNYKWKLFTDGVYEDYQFALELCERNAEYLEHLIPRPFSAGEWLNTLSEFQGIIVPRLHANIVAHSLQIPAVGLVWNNKVRYFAEQIEQADTVFETYEFNAKIVVDKLEELLAKQDENILDVYKATTYDAVRSFVREYVSKRK